MTNVYRITVEYKWFDFFFNFPINYQVTAIRRSGGFLPPSLLHHSSAGDLKHRILILSMSVWNPGRDERFQNTVTVFVCNLRKNTALYPPTSRENPGYTTPQRVRHRRRYRNRTVAAGRRIHFRTTFFYHLRGIRAKSRFTIMALSERVSIYYYFLSVTIHRIIVWDVRRGDAENNTGSRRFISM